MPENLTAHLEFDKSIAAERKAAVERLNKVQFTPLEGQVAFIKELVKSPEEARKFIDDPKQYAAEHGVLIDPVIVEKINQQILFDVALDTDFAAAAGAHATKDLIDMRDRLKFKPGKIKPVGPDGRPGNPVQMAAAVAAGAAVVMAVAAVVTMVVTLVRQSKPQDLISLQGLGEKGTLLPGGIRFVGRTPAVNMQRMQAFTPGRLILKR